ncbi:aminotransferase class I/II-fold pyridoxal phosphate-dependent enzyme [Spirosoma sp. HMF4905]|uniref:Aminotransferase class I/II-fold pyridoxal phosphate-dependent enzyme n=1 Tax=Spirosoma arboris TaxID=2682092 RepID=A0A7K1S3U3_9BACT|nr:aminotransferase class I/II-fold pyridoxal phosphate-dependent enzyme [Spirosoma arboris]MVM28491.1 aminotransferase class I/II-fold pyridoxal phosphate-dependent enzyme [Spirosoma arboris]
MHKFIAFLVCFGLATGVRAQSSSNLGQKSIVQLSLNENPYGPPAGVNQAIEKELKQLARYTGNEGAELVAAIAKREGVDPDQIIPGEILDQLGLYLGLKGGPGGEFIYSVPGYPVLVNAAARVGGRVVAVPLSDRKENDLIAIAGQINDRTQAIFLVNPHNPSGTVSDKQVFHAFLHEASKRALVIIDEAYLEFTDDFTGRTAITNLKQGDNVMVFRTFAKAYGLAGLSIGYAVASKPLVAYLQAQGLGNVHDLNRLSVIATLAAFRDSTFISRVNQAITAERAKWNTVLDKLGISHTNSQANFVYIDLQKPYEEVAARFTQQGIQIGRAFAPYNTWVRITIGLPEENVKAQAVVRQLWASK